MGKSAGKKKEILMAHERNPLIDLVIGEASKILLMSKYDILCGNSTTYNAMARYMIMYVIKQIEPNMPHYVIANNLNYPNHTSSIDGIRRINQIMDMPQIDKKVFVNVKTLEKAVEVEINRVKCIQNVDQDLKYNWELTA